MQRKLIPKLASRNKKLYAELTHKATIMVAKTYPYVFQAIFKGKNYSALLASPKGAQLRTMLIHELTALIKSDFRASKAAQFNIAEKLLNLLAKT